MRLHLHNIINMLQDLSRKSQGRSNINQNVKSNRKSENIMKCK